MGPVPHPPPKRTKSSNDQAHDNSVDFESNLAIPTSSLTVEKLTEVQVSTNRAPLVLAFAVSLLKYTMPEQPLSSRLSLAQAVVSLNSQSKAKSIGLMTDKTAEDEGWSQGQPTVTVMGRSIPVMRRAVPAPSVVPDSDSKDAGDLSGEAQQATQSISHDAFLGFRSRKLSGTQMTFYLTRDAVLPARPRLRRYQYINQKQREAISCDHSALLIATTKPATTQIINLLNPPNHQNPSLSRPPKVKKRH